MTIAQLEEKLTQNPASPLFARLADEYLAAGKVQEAKALCVSGLQQFPAYPTAYLVLARCCVAEGDTQSALDSVSIALEHAPFTPLLHDLQVELTGTTAPEAENAEVHTTGSDEIAVETTAALPGVTDLTAPELTEDATETPDAEVPVAEIPAAEVPAEVETLAEVPEETEMTSSGEVSIDDGMTSVTPLEDELRRSLEEHLHEVLDGEPVAEVPAEPPETVPEISATTTNDETIGQSNEHVKAESPWKDPEEVVREPAEIEQFFNERISELQADGLSEVEPTASSSGPADTASPAAQVDATPVEEVLPAAEAKPAYVPPPPVPEEADALDETTSLGVDGRIVSRTLAEIYVMQGAIAEAILTYQLLKLEKPALRAECDARIRELEPKLQDKPSL